MKAKYLFPEGVLGLLLFFFLLVEKLKGRKSKERWESNLKSINVFLY